MFILSDESINPREKFFGAVVSVEDNREYVLFSKSTDVEGSRDGNSNGCLEVSVIKTLTGIELQDRMCFNFTWDENFLDYMNIEYYETTDDMTITYLRSSRRELDDDGGIVGFGGFEACVNSR